VQGIREFAKR